MSVFLWSMYRPILGIRDKSVSTSVLHVSLFFSFFLFSTFKTDIFFTYIGLISKTGPMLRFNINFHLVAV